MKGLPRLCFALWGIAMVSSAFASDSPQADPADEASHAAAALRAADPIAAEKKLAAAGNKAAMIELGQIYEYAQGVPQDLVAAFAWYEKAAHAGDAWAQNLVGERSRYGIGVARDQAKAVYWFRLAAKNGEPLGEANLGFQYLYGKGVERDLDKSFDHLVTALRMTSNPEAIEIFENLFERITPEEKSTLRPRLLACCTEPDLMAVRGSLPEACVVALHTYSIPPAKNPEAEHLVARLVESGRPQATTLLAWSSFHGQDIPYDLEKARAWAREAIHFNPAQSRFLLAYMDSVAGETPEARTAARTELRQLADTGDPQAARTLGYRLASGLAETRNPGLAQKYFNLSDPGRSSIDEIYPRLNLMALLVPEKPVELPPVTGSDQPPQLLVSPEPIFPNELAAAGFSGEVRFEGTIATDGTVKNFKVLQSSHPLFSASAEAVIARWRFSPERKNNEFVEVRFEQILIFDAAKHSGSRARERL